MEKQEVAEALGIEITSVTAADQIDELAESPALLAREAAKGIFSDLDEEPQQVMESPDGWAVTGQTHAIFMGHDGAFDLVDVPGSAGDTDGDDTDEGKDKPEVFTLVHAETGKAVEGTPPRTMLASQAREQNEQFGQQALPFQYVSESKPDTGEAVFSLDDLQAQVESLLSDQERTEALLVLCRRFDEAKRSGENEKAIATAREIAEAVGKKLIPTPGMPPEPKKPLDVGPGPGKSTASGGTPPKAGTPAAGQPKPPTDTGPGPGKSTSGGGGKKVRVKFPESRIQEFLEIAGKAGVSEDVDVVKTDDSYIVILPEALAGPIGLFFKGEDVVTEELMV